MRHENTCQSRKRAVPSRPAPVVGSIAVGVMLLGLLGMLVYLAVGERARAAEAREAIARAEKQMQTVRAGEGSPGRLLRQPANADVLDRSIFLNSLLSRKGSQLDADFLRSGKSDAS